MMKGSLYLVNNDDELLYLEMFKRREMVFMSVVRVEKEFRFV